SEVLKVAHDGATVVAIAPDGKKLAVGFTYTGVSFTDLAPKGWKKSAAANLRAGDLEKLWADLAEEAPGPGYEAVWTLSAAGEPAVTLLKEKLQPQKAAGEQVGELLKKLDSDKYAVREAAFGQLKKLGPAVEVELRKALDTKVSPEVQKRLHKLVDSYERRPATPEELRQARALMVLERGGSAEARVVLARLAEGAPGAW